MSLVSISLSVNVLDKFVHIPSTYPKSNPKSLSQVQSQVPIPKHLSLELLESHQIDIRILPLMFHFFLLEDIYRNYFKEVTKNGKNYSVLTC